MNLPGAPCTKPVVIVDYSLGDIERKYNVDVIFRMWKYFRINNSSSLRLYPDVNHLRDDLISEQEMAKFQEEYKKIFEPIFLVFIGDKESDVPLVRQMIFMTNNRSEESVLYYKNGNNFLTYNMLLSTELQNDIDTAVLKASEQTGHYGRWLMISIFECQEQTLIDKMTNVIQDIFYKPNTEIHNDLD